LSFQTAGLPAISATVTLSAGPAAAIAARAGDAQLGFPSTQLDSAPSVLVTDLDANPVAGVPVTFATANGASVVGGAQTTNGVGVATVGGWVLGSSPGVYSLT